MLVLTRRGGEGIMIGDGIEVKILVVSGEKVRVGIDAPREISVYRTEVFERIEAEFSTSGSMNGDSPAAGDREARTSS